MKSTAKYVSGSIVFLAFVIFFSIAKAEENISTAEAAVCSDYIYDQQSSSNSRARMEVLESAEQGPIRKFGRGLCNTVFGVFEIPIQIYRTNNTTGGIAAWTYGLTKGIGRFLLREGIGLTEVITFPVPFPGCCTDKYGTERGYGPLMEPEWIFSFKTNPYDFIYPNRPSK